MPPLLLLESLKGNRKNEANVRAQLFNGFERSYCT
jgi:hypothetical protein